MDWLKPIVFLLLLAPSLALAEPPDPSQIEKEVGRFMTEGEAPQSFRVVREIFLPLSESLRKMHFPDRFLVNKIHVVDTDKFFVAVGQKAELGTPGLHHDVYVSRGALHTLLAGADGNVTQESAKQGQIFIAGALAHELAHPVDENDLSGFTHRPARSFSDSGDSQLKELRTDFEGARIAEAAGFPRESVYLALTHLFEKETSSPRLGFRSTHPQDQVRLSGNRLFLTLQRYERGENPPPSVPPVRGGLVVEMQSFDRPAEDKKPLSSFIKSIEKRFKPLAEEEPKYYPGTAGSELREFWTGYAQRLAKQSPLSDKEVAEVAAHHLRVSESPDLWILIDRMAYPDGQEAAALEIMQSSAVFDHPVFRRMVAKRVEKLEKQKGTALEFLMALSPLMTQKEIAENYSSMILNRWKVDYGNNRKRAEADLAPLLHLLGAEHADIFAARIYSEIAPHWSPSELAEFLHRVTGQWNLPDKDGRDFKYYSPEFNPLLLSTQGRDPNELLSQLSPARRKALESIAHFFWKNKEVVFLTHGRRIYGNSWELIALLNGVPLPQMAKELSEGLRDFAKNPERKAARETLHGLVNDGKRGPWEFDSWLTRHLDYGLSSSVEAIGGSVMARHYRRHHPLELREYFAKLADIAIERSRKVPNRIAASFDDLGYRPPEFYPSLDILARKIDQHPTWTRAQKKVALTELFYNRERDPLGSPIESLSENADHEARPWFVKQDNSEVLQRVSSTLKKYGVIENSSDLLVFYLDPEKDSKWHPDPDSESERYRNERTGKDYAEAHTDAVGNMVPELIEEIRQAARRGRSADAKYQSLKRVLERIFLPYNGRFLDRENAPESTQEIQRAAVEELLALPLSGAKRLEAFDILTHLGTNAITDRLLENVVETWETDRSQAGLRQKLEKVAKRQRITDRTLELRLGTRLLEPKVAKLKRPPASDELSQIFDLMHEYIPKSSAARDRWIENLAWTLGIEDQATLDYLDSQKAVNWKTASPFLMMALSQLGSELHSAERNVRLDFIDYLLHPEKGIPASFREHILQQLGGRNYKQRALFSHEIDRLVTAKVKPYLEKIAQIAATLTPQEKLALVELALTAGKDPLMQAKNFPDSLLRRFLGIDPKSPRGKSVKAFLKSVPNLEESVSLAHFLTHSGTDTSGVRESFEVFGTPGRKAGQAAATFKLLPDHLLPELEEFKDSGTPMSKAKIKKLVDKHVPGAELLEVLGSASIKTAVLVRLPDGNLAVVVVKSPDAEAQSRTHLNFAMKFLAEMEALGLTSHSALAKRTAQGLAAQMERELDFRNEAAQIKLSQAAYEKLNHSMKADLGGWSFKVPGLYPGYEPQQDVLVLEYADGTAWGKLPNGDPRTESGALIVASALQNIFGEGLVNPDPHARNVKVNPKTKIIYPFDFGQQISLSTDPMSVVGDERHELARLLAAGAVGDIPGLLEVVEKVTGRPIDSPGLQKELEAEHGKSGSSREKLLGILETLARHKVELPDSFFFGAAKALVTLASEGYVTEEQFALGLGLHVMQAKGDDDEATAVARCAKP